MSGLTFQDWTMVLHNHGTSDHNYQLSEMDQASDPQYFGYLDNIGGWVISRRTISTGQVRYCTGTSDLATSWALRASLTYTTYDQLFA